MSIPIFSNAQKKKGFTLAELLIVVTILMILFGVGAPNVIKAQRNSRQLELDSKAETIYMSVQNRLAKLKASGQYDVYQYTSGVENNGIGKVTGLPYDVNFDMDFIEEDSLCYFTSNSKEVSGSATNIIMSKDVMNRELLDDNWVVEYNPDNAIVYSVFYSPSNKDTNIASLYEDDYSYCDSKLRYKDTRLNEGAIVGYYGGGSSISGSDTVRLEPRITIENAEKLVAHVECNKPTNTTDYPVFKLVLTGSTKYERYYYYELSSESYINKIKAKYGPLNSYVSYSSDMSSNTIGFDIVLDDLSSQNTRFANAYGKTIGLPNGLEAGTNISVDISASVPGNNLVVAGKALTKQTNSLFADESTSDTAVIKYVRHLQNLDVSSGVGSNIKYAVQQKDLHFTNQTDVAGLEDFYETYSSSFKSSNSYFNNNVRTSIGAQNINIPNFKPIENKYLESFTGSNSNYKNSINNLTISTNKDAGLFGVVDHAFTIENTILSGANIKSSSLNVGSLIGKISVPDNSVFINNCQSYLASSDIISKNYHDVWLSGVRSTGGLIGEVEKGGLGISNSSASTVIGEKTYRETDSGIEIRSIKSLSTGGLVGRVSASDSLVYINSSYADSYLTGQLAGGLVGYSKVDKYGLYIENSYAAGYITHSNQGAGLVMGDASLTNSYTVISTLNTSDKTYYRIAKNPNSLNVYYLSNSYPQSIDEDNDEENKLPDNINTAVSKLGDSFTAKNSTSKVYNLMDQGLNIYPYPSLINLNHYGDCKADFQSGALVYYEKYKSSNGTISYGFDGANIKSTLINDPSFTVIGDGYGLVYKTNDERNITIKMIKTNGDSVDEFTFGSEEPYIVTSGNENYYIFAIPKEKINEFNNVQTSYYYKAEVSVSINGVNDNVEYYFFNPHFAKSVIMSSEDDVAPNVETVSVRTARHLYLLSRYHDLYSSSLSNVTFKQERNIDYASYQWNMFSNRTDGNTDIQKPIAVNDRSFKATYDGGCNWITNINFVSDSEYYVGMFGNNDGIIRNVVIRAPYDKDNLDNNYYVSHTGTMSDGKTYYIGVLAGKNNGTITNCATDGYYIAGNRATILANKNSTVYVGGLVGQNTGTITNSSVNIPSIRLSSSFANVDIGGFVGRNSGEIEMCYSIGHLEVVFGKEGSISLAGFAANNLGGSIKNSYSTVALNSSGETTKSYAFAPIADSNGISDSYYLNNGSYYLIDNVYPFEFDTNNTAGSSRTFNGLLVDENDIHKAKYSYDFISSSEDKGDYPFRATVKDSKGNYVHYGDWVEETKLGTIGFFYWEKEVDGENNGYHLTYIGADKEIDRYFGNTTLCNSHDDDGVISEYGYGYFTNNPDSSKTEATFNGVQNSGSNSKLVEYSIASQELHSQFPEYYFKAYKTKNPFKSEDGMILNTSANNGFAEAKITDKNSNTTYTYKFTPFFANSMSLTEVNGNPINVTINIKDKADKNSNYGVNSGNEDNQFEIRSIAQLQYINWNTNKKNTTVTVENGNRTSFPYLVYATELNSASRKTKEAVCKTEESRMASNYYFLQTHDIKQVSANQSFTPIAGSKKSTSSAGSYNTTLYAWFGSHFDGQSYTIRNVDIVSPCFNVGLFGTTVGANMKNIIMYSDCNSVIQRIDSTNTLGAYTLGGLIGVAYDYNIENTNNYIENCAISGYVIKDSSTNKVTLGEVNVGGLVGVAGVHLRNCSAVNTISLESTNMNGTAKYGAYIRAGGLIGAAHGTIENCYTGGEIKVSEDTLTKIKFDSTLSNNNFRRLRVFASGISGSTFTMNYQNLTGGSTTEGNPVFKNCYTYTKLPEYSVQENVTVNNGEENVSLTMLDLISVPIASVADRTSQGGTVTIDNCYFLDSLLVDGAKDVYAPAKTKGVPKPRTYKELSGNSIIDELNNNSSSWGKVTIKDESNNDINGKYSFPGSNLELVGKDYPFPTIVKQKDVIFETDVNVHYGAWPLISSYWKQGIVSMDIFTDMNNEGVAEKKVELELNPVPLDGVDIDDFEFDSSIVNLRLGELKDNKIQEVYVTPNNVGTTIIKYKNDISGDADFTLNITAQLKAVASKNELSIKKDGIDSYNLSIMTKDENSDFILNGFEGNTVKWNITPDINDLLQVSTSTTDDFSSTIESNVPSPTIIVKRVALGETMINSEFTYFYTPKYFNGSVYVNSTDSDGVDLLPLQLKANIHVTISQDNMIGLSDGVKYSASYVSRENETIQGIDAIYKSNVPLPGDIENRIYLYMNRGLGLNTLHIDGIKINGTPFVYDLDNNEYIAETENDKYHLTFNGSTISDNNYEYKVGYLYCVTNDSEDSLIRRTGQKIEIVLGDETTKYDLTITTSLDTFREVTITYKGFDGNGGYDSTIDTVHGLSGKYDLLDESCTHQSPAYKELIGWRILEDDYLFGESVNVTNDITVNAIYDYLKVVLDSNGGEFEDLMIQINAPVNDSGIVDLTNNQYKPLREGYILVGWSKNPNDTSAEITDSISIDNFINDQEHKLYAVWKKN